jgi:hypothetical protein
MKMNDKEFNDIKSVVEGMGIEADLVDIRALWDDTLQYQENKTKIIEHCKNISVGGTYANLGPRQAEQMKNEQQNKRFEDMDYEEDVKESERLSELDTNPDLLSYFKTQREFIKAVLKSKSIHALILKSPPGLGKTHQTQAILKELGMKEGVDYKIVSGYTTAMKFYETAYRYRNCPIIFDDTFNVFEDGKIEAMLLAMLWNPSGKRNVTYDSSTSSLDETVPNNFDFNGKVILLTNFVPKRLRALLSRCYFYEYDYQYPEKLEIMYGVARKASIPLEVVEFIKENTTPDTPNMDLRLLLKLADLKTVMPSNWKEMGQRMLKVDNEDAIFEQIMGLGLTQKEQIEEFHAKTGQTRRTFFRKLKRYREV